MTPSNKLVVALAVVFLPLILAGFVFRLFYAYFSCGMKMFDETRRRLEE